MAFTAAAAGFLVCLLSVQVIQCQDTWGVIYASPTVCAFKGSTVHMNCTYSHPSDQNLRKAFWYVDEQKTPLKDEPEYRDRVEYVCVEKTCTLTITDLRESDSKEYQFRFLTTDDVFSGSPGVVLSVTDVHMQVTKVKVEPSYTEAELSCQSSDQNPYVWIKNGQKVPGDAASYTGRFYPGDSISCAVKESEDCPTPPLYAPKVPSVSVSPSGEIVEGSSVNLTCSRDANIVANYSWYKNQEYVFLSQDPQLVFSSIQSSDSGEYHCEAENLLGGRKSPNISVNVKYGPKHLNVSVSPSAEIVEGSSVTLTCSSDANPAASYTWFKENQTMFEGPEGKYNFPSISSEDRGNYYCKSENQHGELISESVFIDVQYAPRLPSVSVSPSAEIVEGSSVNLTCSSDANPAASYTWFKENQTVFEGPEGKYHFPSISSEDRGNYYCKSENQHGEINSSSIFLDVQYAPRLPSVSVSPSAEIVEGSSVNLTCSSDANPAASYTWFKKDQKLFEGPEGKYHFSSISSEDRGNYYCKSENQHGELSSESVFIDVQYAPKRPFMSVCPSAAVVEGSSVTLTCSSDANPAASYTWFKEDEDSPKVSGQIFIISDFRAEHRGNYSCEAWNSRGIRRSNLHLTVRNGEWVFIVAGTVSATLVAVILISVFLWIRKKRAPKPPSEPEESPETNAQKPATEQKERLHYASIHFSQKQADPVYTSSSPAEAQREEPVERVEYATVIFNSASTG